MKKIFFVLLFIVLVFGIVLYLLIFQSALKGNSEVLIKIKNTDQWEQVEQQLLKNQEIRYPHLLILVAKTLSYPENIRPGRYVIHQKFSTIDIVRKLRNGQQDAVNFVINNITFPEQLAGRVTQKLDIDSTEFMNYISQPEIAEKYGFNTDNFFGMFLCNTYQIYWNISLEKFVDRMHQEYQAFWKEDRVQKANKIGLKPEEVIVLASIVQKETNYQPEFGTVASVYLNRIRIGMPLQADPTVKFALKDMSIKRILKNDLQIDSPYNTYKYTGLPPGPIGLPESNVINGVLDVPINNYLYFCAVFGSGKHVFSTNYSEHLNHARVYQKALNEEKIFR